MKTKKAYLMILMSALSVLNAYSQLPSYVPSNGLVGYWPFNGNANDESGNGNNGTVNGATLTADRNGLANKAYSFDGISNYIKVNNSTSINIIGTQITMSYWLNSNSNINDANYKGISKGGYNVGSGYEFMYRNAYGGDNGVLSITGGTGIQACDIGYNMNSVSGQWIHLVVTFNNGIVKFYVNGVYQQGNNCNQISQFVSNTDDLYIGKRNPSNSWAGLLKGKLDDIGIWNRALTDQEITILYNGCTHETATTNSLNSIILKNAQPINLTASPSLDGQFSGDAITNNQFNPANAHLGKNTIHYNFTNSTGCKDSTDFSVIVADTNTCSTYDTLKIKVKFTAGLYANTINTIKFYPNPTKEVLFIDNGNYQAMSGYSIKIVSLAGTVIYSQPITSQQVQISMNQFATKGLYIAQIVDSNNAIVDSKKIVLE